MTMRARAAAVLIVLSAALAGAGCDSPLGPDGFTLSGEWTGTWQYQSAGAIVTDTVTVTFAQSEDTATGAWTSGGGASGTLTLSPRTSTTGSMTISQTLLNGQTCTGTTTVTGSASGERIDITAADLTPNGFCQWATNQRFVLMRP